jgi:hypothetical protein
MEIFQGLGSKGAIVVGFVSTAAEILVAFLFLRTFKIIRRREYARLKGTEAEHQDARLNGTGCAPSITGERRSKCRHEISATTFKSNRSSRPPSSSGVTDKVALSLPATSLLMLRCAVGDFIDKSPFGLNFRIIFLATLRASHSAGSATTGESSVGFAGNFIMPSSHFGHFEFTGIILKFSFRL